MARITVDRLPRIDQGRITPYLANDFISTTNPQNPFNQTAIASGTAGTPTSADSNHPGVIRIISSTSTNSGMYIGTNLAQLLLAGSEEVNAIFNISTLAGTTTRIGFQDVAAATAPVDGCWIEIDGSGIATGKTSTNSVSSSTSTTGTLSASTWYRAKIRLNSAATLVTFTIYNDAGTVVWTDTLANNIPTAASRDTGVAVISTNSGTSAVDLILLDYLSLTIFRALTRGGL